MLSINFRPRGRTISTTCIFPRPQDKRTTLFQGLLVHHHGTCNIYSHHVDTPRRRDGTHTQAPPSALSHQCVQAADVVSPYPCHPL